MRRAITVGTITLFSLGLTAGTPRVAAQVVQTGWAVAGWNNLGMHCMDAAFSVFSILPPYNTIHAQLIDPSSLLVTNLTCSGTGPRARRPRIRLTSVSPPTRSAGR